MKKESGQNVAAAKTNRFLCQKIVDIIDKSNALLTQKRVNDFHTIGLTVLHALQALIVSIRSARYSACSTRLRPRHR
jgi:hypothetical protein